MSGSFRRWTPARPARRTRLVALIALGSAVPALGEGLLVEGLGEDFQHNWDGMGVQAFFISSINGDEIPEIVTGAHCSDCHGSNSGSITVFDGAPDVFGVHQVLWRVNGDSAEDQLGESADHCGDVDGDGFDDIIVGARNDDVGLVNNGSVAVLSGVDGARIHTFYGTGEGGLFGASVAGVGDITGDGVPDFAVGAPTDRGAGSVSLFSGGDGSLIVRYAGIAKSRLGESVAGAADLNDDGVPEILVGAPRAENKAGRIYVLDGRAAGTGAPRGQVALYTRLGREREQLGYTVGAVGDLNGDGINDISAGAPGNDLVRFYSGVDGITLFAAKGRGADGGNEGRLDGFGHTAATSVGDVDHDSVEDFVFGVPFYDDTAFAATGIAYVYSGATGGVIRTLQRFLDQDDYYGSATDGGGVDFNGDGTPDVLIGIAGYGDRAGGTAYGALVVELL